MVSGKAQILQSSTVRWQFVCDEGTGTKPCFFNSPRINLSAAFLFLRD